MFVFSRGKVSSRAVPARRVLFSSYSFSQVPLWPHPRSFVHFFPATKGQLLIIQSIQYHTTQCNTQCYDMQYCCKVQHQGIQIRTLKRVKHNNTQSGAQQCNTFPPAARPHFPPKCTVPVMQKQIIPHEYRLPDLQTLQLAARSQHVHRPQRGYSSAAEDVARRAVQRVEHGCHHVALHGMLSVPSCFGTGDGDIPTNQQQDTSKKYACTHCISLTFIHYPRKKKKKSSFRVRIHRSCVSLCCL